MGVLKSVTVTDLPASSARALRLPRWARMPVNTGTRGNLPPGPGRGDTEKTGGLNVSAPVSDAPTYEELGVERNRAQRASLLAAIPPAKYEADKHGDVSGVQAAT
jgi:hypothetical protein